jgi:uncharacterized membrane protein YphA (DoxX/SURF4 family)
MTVALWTAQILLGLVFLASGLAKSTMSKEKLVASGQTGVAPFPLRWIRVIAALEILGVAGLILPGALGVAAVLTPIAAVGLALVMVGAAFSHWSLGERRQVFGVNLVLFVACAFVAVGRFAGL